MSWASFRTTPPTARSWSSMTSFMPALLTARIGPIRIFLRRSRRALLPWIRKPASCGAKTRLTSVREFSTASGVHPRPARPMADSLFFSAAATAGATLSTVSITPDGLLFVGDFSGFLHCIDAETGKLYWTHDMKAHMWGSTLVADGKVYAGDEDGDFTVLAASKEKKVLSEVNLGAPVYSTPVVANGVIYVSSNTHLFAFRNEGRSRRDEVPKVELRR